MRLQKLKFLAIITAVVFTSCGKVEEKDAKFPRSQSLFIGGAQWGEATTFNPLSDWPAWPVNGQVNLIYESLLSYNMLTGQVEPLLAQSYQNEHDGISIFLNPNAKWNDGTPVTARDIKFSFEVGRRFKNVPTSHVWDYISKIVVDEKLKKTFEKQPEKYFDMIRVDSLNPQKITFVINKKRKNPLVMMDIIGSTNIIPEHVFGKMLRENNGNIGEVKKYKADINPVGSGPYRLKEYSAEKIVLERDPDYWGNTSLYGGTLPAPKYIIHPIYKSNENYSLALQQGKLDVSETFIPRIWLKARKGVRTWYDKAPYFIPGSIPMFVMNMQKAPLNDKALRKAMAYAINYKDIRELAVSGYSDSLRSGLILPFGNEKKYFNQEDADSLGTHYDPVMAKKILADAGYQSKYDEKGNLLEMRGPDGAVIPTLYIKSPVGWSDWEAIVKIAVNSMRESGIDVRQKFIDAGIYYTDRPLGEFDIILDNPSPENTPSKPWSRFETILSSREWKPAGEKMNRNHGRYKNPAVDSLLEAIPLLKTEAEMRVLYRELNAIVMEELPVIPLVYRPQMFYEFSIKHWQNLPSEQNPYAPPTSLVFASGIKALWQIRPVEQE